MIFQAEIEEIVLEKSSAVGNRTRVSRQQSGKKIHVEIPVELYIQC